MVLSLLTALALTQTPELRSPVCVTRTSRRPNTDAYAPKISARVVEVLKREGVPEVRDDARTVKDLKTAGFSDPRSCNGGQSCSAKLAVLLGPRAVLVAVDVGKVGKSLAIHLEAFAADLAEPLAVADLTARDDKWADQSLAEITTFARQVRERLAIAPVKVATSPPPAPPLEPAPKSDSPTKAALEPQVDTNRTDLTDTAEPAASKLPAIVVASGAGIAAVVSGVFAGLAATDRATWDRNVTLQPDGSLGSTTLTRAEVDALAAQINTRATVALGTALTAAALGGVATWLFLK